MLDIQTILLFIPGFILGLTFHEVAHGWVADKLGDPTARNAGRLTLNPLPHLDPIGSLMLVFAGFGWAKPVPVNPFNLKNPRKDMLWVALAGPAANLLFALGLGIIFQLLFKGQFQRELFGSSVLTLVIIMAVRINIILAVFNLIPVPPLDGSRIIVGLLPPSMTAGYETFERFGPFLLLGLILLGNFAGIPILHYIIEPFAGPITKVLLGF
ncbi:site-2 protease family protein [bacterium]|nr:site-2 protease family protein [bacterium]